MSTEEPIGETEADKKARKAAKRALKEAKKALKDAKKAARKADRQSDPEFAPDNDAADADAVEDADAGTVSRLPAMSGLGSALQSAARQARTALATRLLAHGLYAGQEQVLLALDEGGPQSLGDLAEALGVRAPTITKTVARMEAQKFLARSASETDARSVIIALTPEGRTALAGARQSIAEAEAEVFGVLKKGDRKELARLLAKLAPLD
ncbi:MAG: MarR family transcriptional regulator [Rhizobiaceae bacterium]|nr:MarR family transcriptional regulator [Rhizobiaceae bacterium]